MNRADPTGREIPAMMRVTVGRPGTLWTRLPDIGMCQTTVYSSVTAHAANRVRCGYPAIPLQVFPSADVAFARPQGAGLPFSSSIGDDSQNPGIGVDESHGSGARRTPPPDSSP